MDKVKKKILYGGYDKDTYLKYEHSVLQQDVKNLSRYLLVAGLFFLLLTVASILSSGFARINFLLYFITSSALFGLRALQGITRKRRGDRSRLHLVYLYLFMTVIYAESIFVTLMHKDLPAVTYIGVLLIFPLLFAEFPLRLGLFQCFFVTVFCVCVKACKLPEIAVVDIWNGISFLCVSLLTIYIVTPIRIQSIIHPEIIRELAETDLLTGLKNRNSYEEDCRAIGESQHLPLCIYLDANGLHRLNNTLGHAAGDKMLKTIAAVLKETFGGTHVYRIGGDEFVVFSYVLRPDQAEVSIQALKEQLNGAGYPTSVGFAAPEDGETAFDSILRRAEQRMYEDKSAYYRSAAHDRRR